MFMILWYDVEDVNFYTLSVVCQALTLIIDHTSFDVQFSFSNEHQLEKSEVKVIGIDS